jgi:hypothetical protein
VEINKVFSSRQSILVIVGILILSVVVFIIVQSQITNIEKEAIKREVEIKEQTERMLFDLKEVLLSPVEKEVKTQKALGIIQNIRNNLNENFVYLRIEAQNKVLIIQGRLDEIAEAIIEDPDSAVELVDNLIEDLQNSDDLASFGDSEENDGGNGGSENSPENKGTDYNPDYSDDNNEEDNDTNEDNVEDTGMDTEDPTNPFTEEGGGDDYYYHEGVQPKVDRNRSEDPFYDPSILNTKIGD